MSFYKTVKQNAKRALAGGWGKAIGLMLIAALPLSLVRILEQVIRSMGGIPAYVDYRGTPGLAFDDLANVAFASVLLTLLTTLLAFIVERPLCQGIVRWYYRLTGGEQDGVDEAFHYFETAAAYGRALWLQLQICLRLFFWSVLVCTPLTGGALFLGLYSARYGALPRPAEVGVLLLALVWIVLAALLLAFVRLRYFLAPYLLAAHPEMRARTAIKQGIRYVYGYKAELFGFFLRFLHWWTPAVIAAVLTVAWPFLPFGQPFRNLTGMQLTLLTIQGGLCVYLLPYMRISFAVYARYLIQHAEEGGDGVNDPSADAEDGEANATREYESLQIPFEQAPEEAE